MLYLVVLGVGVAAYLQYENFISNYKIELSKLKINFFRTNAQALALDVTLLVTNPTKFNVGVKNILFNVLYNNVLIAKIERPDIIQLLPEGNTAIMSTLSIPYKNIPASLQASFKELINTGNIKLTVQGSMNIAGVTNVTFKNTFNVI